MTSVFHLLRTTAPWSYVLLFLFVVGLVALGALIATARRQTRARTWLVGAAPLAIAMTGAIGYLFGARKVSAALAGATYDRHLLIRIEAAGSAENLSLLECAAALASILLGLGALAVAAGALRHPWRAKWGLAIGAGLAGLVFAFVFEIIRLKIASRLGVILIVRPSSPALYAAMFASVTALLAGAAISGEGGGSVGHASEEARDRELGAEALLAILAGIGSVVTAFVAVQLSGWATIFGALSGSSVDGTQRVRILEEGGNESYAFMVGAIVFCLAPVIAFGIAVGPKARILARGAKAGAAGLGVCAAAIVALMAMPPIASADVSSRVATRALVAWPSGLEPIAVEADKRLLGDFSTPTFVKKGTSCEDAMRAVGQRPPATDSWSMNRPAATFALDRSTPVSLVHCLGMRALGDESSKQFVEWVVHATFYNTGYRRGVWGERWEVVDASFLMRPTAVTYVEDADARIHVTATAVQGTIPERLKSYASDKRVIQVTADPDVTAQRLFEALAKSGASALFMLAPPTTSPELGARPPPIAPKKRSVETVDAGIATPAEVARIKHALETAMDSCSSGVAAVPLTMTTTFAKNGAVTKVDAEPSGARATCYANAARKVRLDASKGARTMAFRIADGN